MQATILVLAASVAVVQSKLAMALPNLPSSYTATILWSECGDGSGGTCSNDTRTTYFDGTKSAELDILPYVGEKGEHHLLSVGGAGATMKQYEWQVTLGVPHDCSEEKYSYPVQSDWVWLNRSTTREAPVQVKCPYEPTAQCREFQGPWPEQYTELVKLWVKTDSDGQSTPSSLWMHAAGVPFSITKVYKSITAGNPDPSKFVAPKHCDGD